MTNHAKNTFKKIAIVICLIAFSSASSAIQFANNANAEDEPELVSELSYKILVSAEFESKRVDGLIFTVNSTSINKQLESSSSAPTEFSELSQGTYTIKVTIPDSSQYTIDSSLSTRNVVLSSQKTIETVTFQLSEKKPEVNENLEKLRGVVFPASLTKIGSLTTDVTKIEEKDISSVRNFTFDNPGQNKIVFLEGLDLSDFSEYERINQIGEYINLEDYGTVSFNTEFLAPFTKRARVSMSKVRLIRNFDDNLIARINKDGNLATDITNLSYTDNTVSFDVPALSTYSLAPRMEIDLSDLAEDDQVSRTATTDIHLGTFKTSNPNYTLKLKVDNLDATILVTNNGEIVNIPVSSDSQGNVTGDMSLTSGLNRIRVSATLPNDEDIEQFFNVNYTPTDVEGNNISNTFALMFFGMIILGGIALGVYYYRKQLPTLIGRKARKNNSIKDGTDAPDSDIAKTETSNPIEPRVNPD